MKPTVASLAVLSIAGSDPTGGAGVQADLKVFEALGVHGMAIPAALTAQDSRDVTDVWPVPTTRVRRQLEVLSGDFRISAIKLGLLGSAATMRWLAGWLAERPDIPVVLDPVLRASGGARLTSPVARSALRASLIPRATVLTPNLPEAEALLGRPVRTRADMAGAALGLLELGCAAVLLKGGHLARGEIVDLYADTAGVTELRHERQRRSAHGTGCALSSALAVRLALGDSPRAAARAAAAYVRGALSRAHHPGGCRANVLVHRT